MNQFHIRASRGASEYSELATIWRSAVDATHDFVTAADRDAIESSLVSDYLPAVTISVLEVERQPVGFAGIHDHVLEMLFVDAAHRGSGIGSALLRHAIACGVSAVDVNEQNGPALAFYLQHGFEIVGRSATDEAGRPYPILHLRFADTGIDRSTAATPPIDSLDTDQRST